MSTINKMKNDMQFKQAKYSLLALVILSAINLFSIIFTDSYFLFSSYITTFFAYAGYVAYAEGVITLMVIFIVIGIISVIPYLVCFIFAKKHVGWLIGALVLFSIDTLLLLINFISLVMAGDISMILDMIFHVYAIYSLAMAIKYGYQVKADNEAPEAEETAAPTEYSEEMAQVTRNLVIERKKSFAAMGSVLVCYIDDKEVCRLKNGASTTVAIDGNPHTLTVLEPMSYKTDTVNIAEGYGTKNVLITSKLAYRGFTPVIEMN